MGNYGELWGAVVWRWRAHTPDIANQHICGPTLILSHLQVLGTPLSAHLWAISDFVPRSEALGPQTAGGM